MPLVQMALHCSSCRAWHRAVLGSQRPHIEVGCDWPGSTKHLQQRSMSFWQMLSSTGPGSAVGIWFFTPDLYLAESGWGGGGSILTNFHSSFTAILGHSFTRTDCSPFSESPHTCPVVRNSQNMHMCAHTPTHLALHGIFPL